MPKSKRLVIALAGVLAIAGGSCAFFLSAPTPMRKVDRPVTRDQPTRCLIVFLPGMGDDEKVFLEHGFLDALAERRIAIDTISAGATIGYYAKRTVIDRLEEDVLRPARGRGYDQTWLVGVSMGGIGSLLVAQRDRAIDGILLIAPYLGDDDVFAEIERAGGLASWTPRSTGKDDYQRDTWVWLKGAVRKTEERPLYLAAGDKDHLSRGHRLLAAAMPPDHVFRTPGGHDWGPWKNLWAQFLDRSDLGRRCAPRANDQQDGGERPNRDASAADPDR